MTFPSLEIIVLFKVKSDDKKQNPPLGSHN